jgi:hypothetical protein
VIDTSKRITQSDISKSGIDQNDASNRSIPVDHSDTYQQKENPPDPLKKKTTPKNNNHHSLETASELGGGGQEVAGLNGATAIIAEKLAGWINPAIPDRRTAHATLENLVRIYPPDIVRDSFAHLEAKMLSGDVVPSPLKYFNATCRGMHAEMIKSQQKPPKPKARRPRAWD